MAYFAKLTKIKEDDKGQLEILIGIELGLRNEAVISDQCRTYYKRLCKQYPFDFIIGSTHILENIDPYYPEFWEDHGIKEGMRIYFESILENTKKYDMFQVYGHLDYPVRYLPKGMDKDYTNPAVQGFLYCEKLFAYEHSYREKGLSYKQIYTRRLKDEKPVIEGFLAWLKQVDPGSNGKLKKAITYIKNREDFLMTYLEDGRCSFSNNLSENSIRPVTVGRKNWLFSDSPKGAHANTLYLTIVEMAKAYGLDLYKYLNFLFEQRPDRDMSDEELEKLAPWNESVKELYSIK